MKRLSRWAARLMAMAPWRQPPPRPEALPVGFVLGNVTLSGLLGRGSSAAVYAGTDAASGAALAVKIWCPPPGQAGDGAAARAHLLEEARRAQSLDHPGIVRVHRSGTQQDLSYIVMERFDGGSLAQYARPDRRLPEPWVLEIAVQLADALAYAHRQGIVHRDVKPSNALFDPATRRAALGDFGIARAPDAQASRSGLLIGSPAYMAPELLAGQRADAGSDLYALAVLIYELLAGRAPFEAASMGSLLRAVAQAPPPPLATLRPDWPALAAARLDAWFETTLAKDPGRRPADGAAWGALARRTAGDVSGLFICAANTTNRV